MFWNYWTIIDIIASIAILCGIITAVRTILYSILGYKINVISLIAGYVVMLTGIIAGFIEMYRVTIQQPGWGIIVYSGLLSIAGGIIGGIIGIFMENKEDNKKG